MVECLTISNWAIYGLGPLLAEAESYRHLGSRFQPNAPAFDSADLVWAGVLVIGPLLLLLLFKVGQRLRRNFQQYRGEALFLELCRAHELPWRSRFQLWRLVRQLGLQPPAAVYLGEDKLAQAMCDKDRSPAEREEIRLLSEAIFGSTAGVAPQPSPR